jgi:16S rRNA (guanine966-N2)-methyltransferase
MFNALASLDAIAGARVLDLFAGSGALGIEALSRGAEHVTFVDSDRNARRAVETNLATTGYTDRAEVIASGATAYLDRAIGALGVQGAASSAHTLVLLDPPYDFADEDWSSVLDALAAREGIEFLVIESGREIPFGPRWDAVREKWYGGTLLTILQPGNPLSHDPTPEPT